MALTTTTADDIRSNLVTDKPRKLSPEAQILFNKAIIARPLNRPEVASIHVKNAENYYRWVNRLSQSGRVYNERKAMGFVNATTDDVDVLVGDTVGSKDEIRCGDLVLMKIPFELWAGHVKKNMVEAHTLTNMRGVYNRDEAPSQDVFAEGGKPSRTSVSAEPFSRKGGAVPFIPENPDALIDGQSAAAEAKAKAEVAKIRQRHADAVKD